MNDWVNDNHSFDDLFNEFFLPCVLLDFKCIILVQKQHCMMYRSNTLLVNSIFFFSFCLNKILLAKWVEFERMGLSIIIVRSIIQQFRKSSIVTPLTPNVLNSFSNQHLIIIIFNFILLSQFFSLRQLFLKNPVQFFPNLLANLENPVEKEKNLLHNF